MATVYVKNARSGARSTFVGIGDAAELLQLVRLSPDFGPGSVQTAEGVPVDANSPLTGGATFTWFPPARGSRSDGGLEGTQGSDEPAGKLAGCPPSVPVGTKVATWSVSPAVQIDVYDDGHMAAYFMQGPNTN